ncbi:MAG: redoxin domain-containing protein [Thermomicrobiales bacterium]|nr:redoxin domain-containing protein [Thermomicrobiales bacterium]
MNIFILILRAVIIGVLLVSGIAKIPDRKGSEEAMVGFGVPKSLIPLGALLLPWIEIVLAIGLLFAPTLPWAALVVTAMFAVFTLAVARVVLARENLDCHCFGQLDTGPVSWITVGRNTCLTLASAAIFWWAQYRESTSIWHELTWLRTGVGLTVILLAVMAWVIWKQRQTVQMLTDQIVELQALVPAGRVPKPAVEQSFAHLAADHTLHKLDGTTVPVTDVHTKGKPSLLVFVSSHCRACIAIMPNIGEWQQQFGDVMRIAVLGVGMQDELQLLTDEHALREVYLAQDGEMQKALAVKATPTSILVDHDGFIRQAPTLGTDSIRRLMDDLKLQAGIA